MVMNRAKKTTGSAGLGQVGARIACAGRVIVGGGRLTAIAGEDAD
jgi:hypothetical protein